jgi:hypothetical protein
LEEWSNVPYSIRFSINEEKEYLRLEGLTTKISHCPATLRGANLNTVPIAFLNTRIPIESPVMCRSLFVAKCSGTDYVVHKSAKASKLNNIAFAYHFALCRIFAPAGKEEANTPSSGPTYFLSAHELLHSTENGYISHISIPH